MAGGIDQAYANAIMTASAINSGTATVGTYTITGPQLMRLMTANGSDTSNGTELATGGSGPGYTNGGLAMTLGTASAAAYANSATVSWAGMPACSLTGMEQWESTATKKRLFWAPWSSGTIVVAATNTFAVAIGGYTPSLV